MKAFHEVRTYGSELMVWCSTYENISFLAHWHKEIEFIYVREGTCHISVADQCFTAHGGDLVICDSGNIHYSDSHEGKNVMCFLVFDPGVISSVYEFSKFLYPHVTREQLKAYGLAQPLEMLFEEVSRELERQDKYYQDVVKAKIRAFWYLLKRYLPHSDGKTVSYNKRIQQMYDFQRFLSYMEEHYNENISLEYASEQMNFSPSHFSRVFKKLTGVGFVTYLNMIRVEHAAEQLRSTTNKITDIGLACGFNNTRTFNRVFKEITGYTPTEFSRDAELDVYNQGYPVQKYSNKQYVENDSMTVIHN